MKKMMRNAASGKVNTSPSSALSKKKIELIKAFQSAAKSVDKMLKIFKKIEKLFPESELGSKCWVLADQLLTQGRSPEQVISFGNRALRIFIDNDTKGIPSFGNTKAQISSATAIGKGGSLCAHSHKSSLYIASVCNLLATACCKLKRYDECLSYLNWANRNLSKLLEDDDDSSCGSYCLLNTLLATQIGLYIHKHETGRFDEAVITLMKVLEIQEILMEEGCIEIGIVNKNLCDIYLMLMKYKEALPFCLKALEIYTEHYRLNSLEVAKILRNLAVIYFQLGEFAKALEQSKLSQNILKNMTPNSPELLDGQSCHGDILIGLGRHEEAIDVLKYVVSHTDTPGTLRGFAFIAMARAFCCLEKFDETKKYLRTAQRILEKMEDPINVAVGFGDMSRLYEKMNDFENSITFLRRSLSIPQIPPKCLVEGSARLFSLISLSGKEDEGIAYMEDVVEKLKEKFGAEHYEVGHGYKNLGSTYLKLGQEELAVKFMVKAKDIMDVTLGPCHLDSLKTSQTCAETYATLRSYDLAMEIQKNVVCGLKELGPTEQEKLDEAVGLLEKMEVAIGADRENSSAKSSNCVVSEDGKAF